MLKTNTKRLLRQQANKRLDTVQSNLIDVSHLADDDDIHLVTLEIREVREVIMLMQSVEHESLRLSTRYMRALSEQINHQLDEVDHYLKTLRGDD